MITLEEEWHEFRKMVIPNEASQVQLDDMKRAFFAGATIILNYTRSLSDDQKDRKELAFNRFLLLLFSMMRKETELFAESQGVMDCKTENKAH